MGAPARRRTGHPGHDAENSSCIFGVPAVPGHDAENSSCIFGVPAVPGHKAKGGSKLPPFNIAHPRAL